MKKYEVLFEPFTFSSGVQLANRIVMAPMTTWSGEEDGNVSEAEIAYLRRRSKGLGAVITACAHVTRGGQGFSREIGAFSDELLPSLTKIAATIKEQGPKAILQIYHGGRMSPPELLPDKQPVSASAVPQDRPNAITPREMTEKEILETIEAFGEATKRAIKAGFDGVEIHGANQYLFQQFFSPQSNRRNDYWGGSLEKRMNFSLSVIREVKRAIESSTNKPFILGYRLSPEEKSEPGITIEDTLAFVDALANEGMDYLHISLPKFFGGSIRTGETTPTITLINEKVGKRIPIIGVGSLKTPNDVLNAYETGIPLLALGRELIIEPDWIEKVQEDKVNTIRTTLTINDQEKLVIPNQLWHRILETKGWFPVVEAE